MEISPHQSHRAVARWVLAGLIMLCIQVILGGITRLTGSGLSITEWNIITGTLPPLSANQWNLEFAKYRATPQFRLLNADFSLEDFQFIFFWEWFHRLWARAVGVVFILGFLYLLAKRKLKNEMIVPLLVLFLLGALQGAVGWIMVLSGLTGDALYVRPVRLALHFVFAMGLICYTFWFYLRMTLPVRKNVTGRKLRRLSRIILGILFFQLVYGALMAGGKLATAAPTWPTINGDWIPDGLFTSQGAGPAWIENRITVHFIHRGLAYLLLLLTIGWSVLAYGSRPDSASLRKYRSLPFFNLTIQVLLGIMIVLLSPEIVPNHWGTFEWFALAHQVSGMMFMLVMVYMLFVLQGAGRKS